MVGGGRIWVEKVHGKKKINILTFGLSNNVPTAWDFKRLKRLSLLLFYLLFFFPSSLFFVPISLEHVFRDLSLSSVFETFVFPAGS